ncbi:MAG: ABC transporter ATP-binding protein [Mycoplasmatales bacterium]
MNAIEVKNVTKIYKLYDNEKDILKEIILGRKYHREFTALKNINFKVKQGDTYGILGGNGSGKSTILSIINGTTYPTKGDVKTKGKVALLNVGAGIIAGYTGMENIYYKCGLMGVPRKKIDKMKESIIEFSELGEFINHKVNKYSSGMKSKLGFAIAIHVEPDVLIVDEALAVGDSRFAKKCHDKMDELKKKGITIIYVSHSHHAVRSFCKHACWINQGEFIGEGKAGDLSKIYEKFMNDKIDLKTAKKEVKGLKKWNI